jgi:hypothetical protein
MGPLHRHPVQKWMIKEDVTRLTTTAILQALLALCYKKDQYFRCKDLVFEMRERLNDILKTASLNND